MINKRRMLHPITRRKRSPSRPARPQTAAPIARFCGEIILPRTPPEELAAASSVGLIPAFWAAVACSTPKSEFDDVSEPVTAVPIQPMIGEKNASTPPAPAIQVPMVIVCADRFITYASPSTAATVSVAHLS